MVNVKRFLGNPILAPNKQHSWETEAVFNGCILEEEGAYPLLYRAMSSPQEITGKTLELSTVGYAMSFDRIQFHNRRQLIVPQYDWERYGCEDPRITKLDDRYFICYTALSNWPPGPENIRVAVAVSRDLLSIEEKHLVTPFNAKAMALFPEKINGKVTAILTAHTDMPPPKIAVAKFDAIEQIWDEAYWKNWYSGLDHHVVPLLRSLPDHLEVGAPPIKTAEGWLLIYCYIRNYQTSYKTFGIEAVLLDGENPTKVLGRTETPLMSPERNYELTGKVPNVIFPSGALLFNNNVGVYYGAADTTCC